MGKIGNNYHNYHDFITRRNKYFWALGTCPWAISLQWQHKLEMSWKVPIASQAKSI